MYMMMTNSNSNVSANHSRTLPPRCEVSPASDVYVQLMRLKKHKRKRKPLSFPL